MYLILTELFAIVILSLISANLAISLLILMRVLASFDKADTWKKRYFPFMA